MIACCSITQNPSRQSKVWWWHVRKMIYLMRIYIYCYLASCVVFELQYIPRNMHTVFALLCFVVVIHWLIFPYPSGLLHWHCGNLTIAPVPAKQPWWIWINTSCEFIMNDCITTTKQSTTKPCAYFLGYTVMSNFVASMKPVFAWSVRNDKEYPTTMWLHVYNHRKMTEYCCVAEKNIISYGM